MTTAEQPAHRKAVTEARARARENAAVRARERRRTTSVLVGFGLSFVLLGGSAGGYMALDSFSAGAAGPSVAISLVEEPVEPATVRHGAVQVALANTTEFQISLPAATTMPLAAALPEAADRHVALGAALEALEEAGDDPEALEAQEAALARLYEEPLETAAVPLTAEPEGLPGGPVQQAALPLPPVPPLPEIEFAGRPAWQRFAVSVAAPGARPMIAVVLDDLGLNRAGTRRAIDLPAPLTLAFMTYAEGLPRQVARARRAGHELMLHVPMAPRDPSYDPGPNVLHSDLTPAELARRLEWGLGRFEGYVGINNHMGSRFTGSTQGMTAVMAALRARGLLFLDSVTAGTSRGAAMAQRAGVPYATRDVFLDNEWSDRAAIARQFARLEAVARRNGSAVGIGHPHRATLDVLARWLPEARARGFAIVPISAIVRHRMGLGTQYVETSG
jgi:polysaccharide deacetylase 2 family uncharacterized protein YibQ